MKTVKNLLETKGTEVFSVTPDTPIYEALKMMSEKGVGALLVIESGALKGIFSERDYARKVEIKSRSAKNTLVKEVMTEKVVCTNMNQTLEECMALMTDKHFRHLPVIDSNKIRGLISIGDVVKAIISEQQFAITQLENYITGI
jgi:CBS domain-containing protein